MYFPLSSDYDSLSLKVVKSYNTCFRGSHASYCLAQCAYTMAEFTTLWQIRVFLWLKCFHRIWSVLHWVYFSTAAVSATQVRSAKLRYAYTCYILSEGLKPQSRILCLVSILLLNKNTLSSSLVCLCIKYKLIDCFFDVTKRSDCICLKPYTSVLYIWHFNHFLNVFQNALYLLSDFSAYGSW